MEYLKSGMISSKKLSDASSTNNDNYELNYLYPGISSPTGLTNHQPEEIRKVDLNNNLLESHNYQYNDAGSISQESIFSATNQLLSTRNYCWDEEQRLAGVKNEAAGANVADMHHYVYDQNGERIMKTSFSPVALSTNSQSINSITMAVPTVYVNAYFIANHYAEAVLASKHYYMGSQRVASKLESLNAPYNSSTTTDPNQEPADPQTDPVGGMESVPSDPPGGNDGPLSDPTSDGVILNMQEVFDCLTGNVGGETGGIDWPAALELKSLGTAHNTNCPLPTGNYSILQCYCEESIYHTELQGLDCDLVNVMYWYHPDYLGSVEWVTDSRGEPYQFFLNTVWGRNLENQRAFTNKSFVSRFRFNGKELDPETGNYYYGARYYDPKISVWLSVDAMATKQHNLPLTPYHFSANNPLVFIDPDGNDWFVNKEGSLLFLKGQTEVSNAERYGTGWKNIGDDDMFGDNPLTYDGRNILELEKGDYEMESTETESFLADHGKALSTKYTYDEMSFEFTTSEGEGETIIQKSSNTRLISTETTIVDQEVIGRTYRISSDGESFAGDKSITNRYKTFGNFSHNPEVYFNNKYVNPQTRNNAGENIIKSILKEFRWK